METERISDSNSQITAAITATTPQEIRVSDRKEAEMRLSIVAVNNRAVDRIGFRIERESSG